MFGRIFAALGVALAGLISSASAEVTLPTIGVSAADYVNAAGTEIGTVLAAVFGLFVVLLVIFGSMRWLKRVRSA